MPLVALPEVTSDGDTLVEPVTVVTSGPLQVYVAAPAPPALVAVRVMAPPEHNGLVALEISADTDGWSVIV